MSDSTSRSDKEPGTSVSTTVYGDIHTQQLHTGVGNNYADAGNILLNYAKQLYVFLIVFYHSTEHLN